MSRRPPGGCVADRGLHRLVNRMGAQGTIGVLLLLLFLALALLGPIVAPYDPWETLTDSQGRLRSLQSPSREHLLGTTWQGRDVLSQLLYGGRSTVTAGLFAALLIAVIGVQVGLLSAYLGGGADLVLMRFVDLLYGLPFLPFLIVAVSLLGRSQSHVVLAIGLIAWRDVARTVRSQVLTTRELPYIQAARSLGAGHWRIMYVHILPAILPEAMLLMAFGMVWSVLAHADITFLGFGDPEILTWGGMINSAWAAGAMRTAFWWYLPPAICIATLSLAAFLVTRIGEEMAGR